MDCDERGAEDLPMGSAQGIAHLLETFVGTKSWMLLEEWEGGLVKLGESESISNAPHVQRECWSILHNTI